MSFLLIASLLGLIVVFVLSVIAVILYTSKKEIPKDRVFIINFLRQYTENDFAKGYQTKVIRGEKRSIVEYLPTDINYEKTKKIKPQKIVVQNDKIIPMMKGTLSNHESELWLLPPKAEDLPQGLKESQFGKMIMEMIENINYKVEERDIIRSAMETQSSILKDTRGMKLAKEHIEIDKGLLKDAKKKMMEDKQQGNRFYGNQK